MRSLKDSLLDERVTCIHVHSFVGPFVLNMPTAKTIAVRRCLFPLAAAVSFLLLAPGIALADGEPVPGSFGCPTVQSVIASRPPGTDFLIVNLETGNTQTSSSNYHSNFPLPPGLVTHTALRSKLLNSTIMDDGPEDPHRVTGVNNISVKSRSDCSTGKFYTYDRYGLDTTSFTWGVEPEIVFQLWFAPRLEQSNLDLGATLALDVVDAHVTLDWPGATDAEANARVQELWEGRHALESAYATFLRDWVNDTGQILTMQLAGDQDLVLILAPFNGCAVYVHDCPNASDRAHRWNYDHDYHDTDRSQVRCLQRADEYYNWCGARQHVTAQFNESGVVVDTWIAGDTVCQVHVRDCPLHRDHEDRWLDDDFDGSGSSRDRCLLRASEYYNWCGASQHVTAQFTQSRAHLADTRDSPGE
jgi:hypothetical protein